MEKLLSSVLAKLKPSEKEEKELLAFSAKIVSLISSQKYKASVEGSIAKGTWISGDHDIDLFVFFDTKVKREVLEKKGLEIGKKVAKKLKSKYAIEYAEHPYTSIFCKNFKVDIVPCYFHEKLTDIHSAVDRTPFHTAYVRKKLNKQQKDEVRLLKQFMKGTAVYSAKEKVHGFSGYLCELLIIYYGSFLHAVKEIGNNWKYRTIIDIDGAYKPIDAEHLKSRFKSPLVFIDPTDKNRNVGAALGNDKFEEFIYACKSFLKKPSDKFFFPNAPKLLSAAELKKQLSSHGKILIVKFKTPKLIEDVLFSQLRSSANAVSKQFKLNEFRVLETEIFSDADSCLLFELEDFELPKIKVIEGPPVSVEQRHQDRFAQKYKKTKPWVEKGRWYAEAPRKFLNADDFAKEIVKRPQNYGIGKYVAGQLKKKHSIISGSKISKEYKGEFAKFFTSFLTKKKPWEW